MCLFLELDLNNVDVCYNLVLVIKKQKLLEKYVITTRDYNDCGETVILMNE